MSFTKAELYSRSVAQKAGSVGDDRLQRRSELAALVQATLGRPLEPPTFEALLVIQARLRARQTELVAQLELKAISRERYLAAINSTMKSGMTQSRVLLGNDTFVAIFGDAGQQAADLIDRDTFLKTARSLD